eukprot:CAMPEP_0119314388 /NCGR_PEP_ID=MMETSP1333-20130426/32603_1 /TAXON_ID=418940 /ORGANISM="Scyphosphaera apsteinii, Strain RCC1455" /LENGTH=58 /DNA_ID=CAMNT_0007319487 /DNA_START=284 /DNA_END=456 /DNA_ORIENTATION=+
MTVRPSVRFVDGVLTPFAPLAARCLDALSEAEMAVVHLDAVVEVERLDVHTIALHDPV